MNPKIIVSSVIAVIILIVMFMTAGINNAGYRTVVQYPSGKLEVVFDSGIYFPLFGKTTEYPDYLTFDFSPEDGTCDFTQNDGIRVRYQDGGEGAVCGMANVQLSIDEDKMLAFHKRYRTVAGARSKLLNQTFPKVLNLTAALMSSEEAYATKRSEYIRMSKFQAENGLYETELVEKTVIVGVDENGNDETQLKDVPSIVMVGPNPQTVGSDFAIFDITLTQFDLKAWDFEPKTIKQIQAKRSAEMAIVTAKANAKKAYWEEQQVIADGKKNVASAEYSGKVAAESLLQVANRDKELALITASKIEETAILMTAAAKEATKQKTEEARTAIQQAKIITTLANANAYKLRKEQEAGELKLKLDAMVRMNADNATAQARRAVPTTVIYSGGEGNMGSGTDVSNILGTQLIKNLSNLNLSMAVK